MAEKSLSELPRDLRELFQKGNAALQRQNYDYALTFFEQILKREPAFFEARQALRVSQFKKAGASSGFFKKVLGGASASPLVAKAQMQMRKNPLESLQIGEQILNSDPHNTSAHKIIAEAAMAADFPRTACLSLEILLKNAPRDYDLSMKYGEALVQSGQIEKAENLYAELIRAYPRKNEIAQALKNLSARKTMEEGGYETAAQGQGSYRDLLKDKQEAAALEQEHRVVKSDDVTANLIREYEARRDQEPGNMKLLRNLAELYTQQKEFDRALEYYEIIHHSEVGNDPSLERAIADTRLRQFDHEIEQLDLNQPEQATRRAALQAGRDAFQINECKTRVERYPTDLQIRFELGELYFKAGKYSEAIQEFQKAQNYPSRRLSAMSYLGQCFAQRGMHDLAARKFQDAIKEKPVFDDEKKELIYQLGLVLEKMGRRDEAIEQFKQVYEEDISFRDVAAKVDAFYSSQ